MQFLIYSFVFIFGLIIASFLNSVIYRLSISQDFLFGKSYCPNCKHDLNWSDLIPLISFLVLKGKCRYCKKPISIQYVLVELATAVLFVILIWQNIDLIYDFTLFRFLNLCFMLYVVCSMIVIFVYDLKHYIIPDKVIFPAIIAAFSYQLFDIWNSFGIWTLDFDILKLLLNPILSAIVSSLFFLSIVLGSRGKWMGMGDVKLAFLMGLFLGFPKILIALFLAFFIGAIIGISLIILGEKTFKSEVPFGPFLIMGTFLALLFEHEIINFYLSVYY